MARRSPTGELEIQFAILSLMLDGRIWSNADLKRHLRNSFAWTQEDMKVGARPNEYVWENRINNALSPSRRSFLYAKGHVTNCGRGLHLITDEGRKFITEDFDLDEIIASI